VTVLAEPLDFIDAAPVRFVSKVDLAITPEQLFEVLGDAESWPHWATVITKVVWTSPEPRGVGTTRTVTMRGNIVGDKNTSHGSRSPTWHSDSIRAIPRLSPPSPRAATSRG
jgi:hypothetical protein